SYHCDRGIQINAAVPTTEQHLFASSFVSNRQKMYAESHGRAVPCRVHREVFLHFGVFYEIAHILYSRSTFYHVDLEKSIYHRWWILQHNPQVFLSFRLTL